MTPDELRDVRAALCLTLVEFGEALDVDERTVRRWECGAIPIPRAVAVAAVFVRDLFRRYLD